ncbi:MAG: RecQ family ATP-dependent DNA helicase [Flavobacteriales bacterium]|nr:RecQ family ATP-dependent DNA helicase [Flavobacteriales bacterium]
MDIHEVLKKHWGYTSFRPMQEAVIRAVLADKDTLALLPTGGGKSVCYQVPALARGGLCIVVSPLIALMRDQVLQARARGITAKAVMSGMARYEVESTLEEAALGHVSLLYVAPERIASDLFRARLPRMPVTLIAVDEAHCVSQWGYDFRPSYMRIPELREVFPEVPIIALTATATTDVAQDIQARLGFRKRNLFRAAFQRPELTFWVSTGEDKLGRLFRILDALPGSGIVYVRDRRGTLDLARTMVSQGVTAAAYHAGLPHAERERVQNEWLSGKLRYVVATNAFGMGIDKPDVRCVIHMAPPPDLESYYQEAGRAGRDGRPAHAFLLLDEGDPERMLERVRGGFPTMEQVRKTYQAFADAHRIALGSGEFEAYALDLRDLARRAALAPTIVMNALKALELDGTIALSEGIHAPSRVHLVCDARTVHALRVNDAKRGPLLETLLRLQGGLFDSPASIDEERISQLLQWSVDQVRKTLMDLRRMDVLTYHARNDAPLVTLLVPRRDAHRLTLDPRSLADREKRAIDRANAMIAYCAPTNACREGHLLRYFGEAVTRTCGRCDRCTRRERSERSNDPGIDPSDIELLRWEADHRIPS